MQVDVDVDVDVDVVVVVVVVGVAISRCCCRVCTGFIGWHTTLTSLLFKMLRGRGWGVQPGKQACSAFGGGKGVPACPSWWWFL